MLKIKKNRIIVLSLLSLIMLALLVGIFFRVPVESVLAATMPNRPSSVWDDPTEEIKDGKRYLIYRSKNDVKDAILEDYVNVSHNPSVSDTEAAYTTQYATGFTLTVDGTIKATVKAGFLGNGGSISIAQTGSTVDTTTIATGTEYSQELGKSDKAGIYRLRVHTKLRKFAIDIYEPNMVTKSRTYQTTEGKSTVTKTEYYQVQEGWKYVSSTERYYFDCNTVTKMVTKVVQLDWIQSLPTIVG